MVTASWMRILRLVFPPAILPTGLVFFPEFAFPFTTVLLMAEGLVPAILIEVYLDLWFLLLSLPNTLLVGGGMATCHFA